MAEDNVGKKLLKQTDVLNKNASAKIQALKEIRNTQDFKYSNLAKALKEEILNTIPEGSITAKDFSKIDKAIKEIPESEILDLYNRFTSLPPEERRKYRIGSGAFKDAYQLPDSDLVLKTADKNLNILEKDYLAHKITNKLGKKGDIETPMLVKSPDKEAVLMQRRLVTPDDILKFKNAAGDSGVTKINPELYNRAYFGGGLQDEIDNLIKGYTSTSMPEDVHAGNVGIDPVTNKMKIFDTLGSVDAMDVVEKQTPRFSNILSNLKKPTIYRSIAPTLLKGLGAAAGGAASLAAEASDAEDLGNAPEQATMLREIDQANREKKMLGMIPEQNKAAVEKELEDQRLGLRRSAIESLLKK
jgi:hypothetical protein